MEEEIEEIMDDEDEEERRFVRFTKNQVAQHIILFVLFIILSITGLCLTFSETWLAQQLVGLMGGWEMRMYIHRGCGVILVVLGIYHVIYVALDRNEYGNRRKMLPGKSDAKEVLAYLKHSFGKGPAPKYDRFSFKEKFDYWGALWGMVLMGITGLIMMYPVVSTRLLPFAYVNLSRIMHSHEATIAISFITIWHLYNVHFAPHRTRGVWLTGTITETELKEHHPVEYEDLKRSDMV